MIKKQCWMSIEFVFSDNNKKFDNDKNKRTFKFLLSRLNVFAKV